MPEGYAGSDPQTVEIVEGETATATFTNTLLVGNISITKTNEAGEPLGGACFTFDGQIVCDNEEGDGNEEAGIIDASGVPIGSVETESTAPAGHAISGDPQTVEVVTGETATVTFINVQLFGAVSITKPTRMALR